MDKQQRQLVEKNIREAKEKLEAELESAKNEHQLMLMTQGHPVFYTLLPYNTSPPASSADIRAFKTDYNHQHLPAA